MDAARNDVSFMKYYDPTYYDFVLLDASLKWCIEITREIRQIEGSSQDKLKFMPMLGLLSGGKHLEEKQREKYFRHYYRIGMTDMFCFPLSDEDAVFILERYGPFEVGD